METQNNIYDLENQINTYTIPLSNEEIAKITHELRKVPSKTAKDIFEAKLSVLDFISTYTVGGRGSIKVTTTVNITHVPDMNSSELDLISFTAYNGRVEATPFQLVSISGTSASTSEVYPNIWYETTGYVGFNVSGVSINYYYTQKISFISNTGADRNKIKLDFSGGL